MNVALIVINVLVFVFLQGMGTNDAFTMAMSTVPAEIASGKDLVTDRREKAIRYAGRARGSRGARPAEDARSRSI